MSTDHELSLGSAEALAFVASGLLQCHGHRFAVYADVFKLIGSEVAITQCAARLLRAYADSHDEPAELVVIPAEPTRELLAAMRDAYHASTARYDEQQRVSLHTGMEAAYAAIVEAASGR